MTKHPTRGFSTATLSPSQGAVEWRGYLAKAYDDWDVTPSDSWRAGQIREMLVGSIGISIVAVDAQKVVRRKGAVPAGSEDYLVVLPTRGAVLVNQGRQSNVIEAGDACILNAAEYYEGWMPDSSGNVAFKLPAHLLRSRLGSLENVCGRSRITNPHMIPILQRFATDLFSQSRLGTPDRLEEACVSLLTVLLDWKPDCPDRHRSTVAELLVSEVRSYLDRNLGDPTLTIGSVATGLGVSVRLIQKAMQLSTTTFSETLIASRLDRAFKILRTRTVDDRSIGQIAFDCGFVSQSHFSVRFRNRFGVAPRDVCPVE